MLRSSTCAFAGTQELKESFYQHSGQAIYISAFSGLYPVQEQPDITAGLVLLVSIVGAVRVRVLPQDSVDTCVASAFSWVSAIALVALFSCTFKNTIGHEGERDMTQGVHSRYRPTERHSTLEA